MARKSNFFWWVPFWGETLLNTGQDTVGLLVDTESGNTEFPQQDNFVVERIFGQWQLVSSTGLDDNVVYHQRVYPTVADATTVALRDLDSRDDADSDFMWHAVHMWSAQQGVGTIGSWASGGAGTGFEVQPPFSNGRYGHVDIKVARRIQEGEALVWHLQSTNGVPPADSTVQLRLWLRVLLREG